MTDASETIRFQCRICSATSAWKRGFVDAQSVRHGPHRVCLGCLGVHRKYTRFYRRIAFWSIAGVAAGWIFLDSPLLGALGVAITYLVLYLAALLHELGHALAAKIFGFDILAFSLGGGIRAKVVRWRGVFLIVGPFAIEGLVMVGPKSLRLYRTRLALLLLSGPLVNIIAFVVGLKMLGSLSDDTYDPYVFLLMIWTYANFALMLNLLPMRIPAPMGDLASDGLQLLRLPRLTDAQIARVIDDVPVIRAQLAFGAEKFELAYSYIEHGIRAGTLSSGGRILATAVLLESGRIPEGIELIRQYLAQEEFEPHERALLQNNLAYALIIKEVPDIVEADQLSEAAIDVLPMLPEIIGTRGFVLFEKGEYRDAIGLLSDRKHRLGSRDGQAMVSAYLAMAWANLGDKEKATKILRRASWLGPDNPHVRRASEYVMRAESVTLPVAP